MLLCWSHATVLLRILVQTIIEFSGLKINGQHEIFPQHYEYQIVMSCLTWVMLYDMQMCLMPHVNRAKYGHITVNNGRPYWQIISLFCPNCIKIQKYGHEALQTDHHQVSTAAKHTHTHRITSLTSLTSHYLQHRQQAICLLTLDAGWATSMGIAFSRVCLFLCPCSKRKTAWAIDTKLCICILYSSRSVCVDPEVKRSKAKVTRLRKPSQLHGC